MRANYSPIRANEGYEKSCLYFSSIPSHYSTLQYDITYYHTVWNYTQSLF